MRKSFCPHDREGVNILRIEKFSADMAGTRPGGVDSLLLSTGSSVKNRNEGIRKEGIRKRRDSEKKGFEKKGFENEGIRKKECSPVYHMFRKCYNRDVIFNFGRLHE